MQGVQCEGIGRGGTNITSNSLCDAEIMSDFNAQNDVFVVITS